MIFGNNLLKISLLTMLICSFTNLFGQYGSGTDGASTISSTTNLSLTATNVTAVAGSALTTLSAAGFAANDEILLIQMTGSSGNEGNWEQLKVASVSGSTVTLTTAPVKSYDASTEKVQLIKLPQYTDVTLNGTLTTAAWNGNTGGVLTFMANNDFTISGGKLDMIGKGFNGSNGGAGGTGGIGGAAGIHGDPASAGGNTGTAGEGIFGGKNGGATGGTAPIIVPAMNPNVPGAGIPATNASNKSSKRYVLGAGGTGGNGGIGGIGGGGGGGGSDQPTTSTVGTDGTTGSAGGIGGAGGNGGTGGGLILIFVKNFVAGSGVQFCAAGTAGTSGTSATTGGAGGVGGTGGGRECNGKGGGGGGGNGAGGGSGGNGGNGGAGGFIYMKKATGSTLTAGMVSLTGGAGGAGGTKGIGGAGGANGTDSNPSCLPCGPSTTLGMTTTCGTAGALLTGLNYIDGTATSTYTLGGYRIWSHIPNVGVGIVQIGTALTDCQGTPYFRVQMGQNFNPLATFTSGTQYFLVSSTATSPATLETYLNTYFSNPASPTGAFNDVSINDGTHTWVQECYAGICGARAASMAGPDGGDGGGGGAPSPGDFDSESVAPLPIKLLAFEGKKETNQVRLDWRTETESNFSGFEIQKSMDGNRFEKIGFSEGKGKNGKGASYFFLDKNTNTNENCYYKLNALDEDGRSEFSKIIVVSANKTTALSNIEISPVPTNSVLNVRYQSPKNMTLQIRIVNNLGEIVKNESYSGQTGDNYFTLNVEDLPVGIYHVRFSNENNIDSVLKMFIKK